jgi:hypothetical protein
MTRTFKVLIAMLVVLVLIFAVAGSIGASDEPQLVRVTLKDYQVELSQFTIVPDKKVDFVIANKSAQPHQFILEPYASAEKVNAEQALVIGPGTMWTIQRTLTPGIYRATCAIGEHAKEGMINVLAAQTEPRQSLPIQTQFGVSILALVLGCVFIIGDSLGLRLTHSK